MAKAPIKPITLKELAAMLELSQSTVSRIINGEATAHRIAEETQQRVLHAAALNGYIANNMARGLRQKRTYTIGVLVPEISEGYSTTVISGIEDELLKTRHTLDVTQARTDEPEHDLAASQQRANEAGITLAALRNTRTIRVASVWWRLRNRRASRRQRGVSI